MSMALGSPESANNASNVVLHHQHHVFHFCRFDGWRYILCVLISSGKQWPQESRSGKVGVNTRLPRCSQCQKEEGLVKTVSVLEWSA